MYLNFLRNGFPKQNLLLLNYPQITPAIVLSSPSDNETNLAVGSNSSGSIFYVITSSDTLGYRLYRSTDNGASYTSLSATGLNSANLMSSYTGMSVSDNGMTLLIIPNTINDYYNIYYSTNGGDTFTVLGITNNNSGVVSGDGTTNYIESLDYRYRYTVCSYGTSSTTITTAGFNYFSDEVVQSENTTSLYLGGGYFIVGGIPVNLSTIGFTVEGFVNFSSIGSDMRFFFTSDSQNSLPSDWNNAVLIGINQNNMYFKLTVDDVPHIVQTPDLLTTGQWYHWAYCHDGVSTYLCLNGTIIGQFVTTNWAEYLKILCFGTSAYSPNDYLLVGAYLSNFRISNTALYTGPVNSSYNLPALPYPTTNDPNMIYIQTFGNGTPGHYLTAQNYKTSGEYYGTAFTTPQLNILLELDQQERIGYLSTSYDGSIVVGTSTNITSNVYISTTSGLFWTTTSLPHTVAGSAVSSDGSYIYVGLLADGGSMWIGLAVSTDQGQTWKYLYHLNASFRYQNIQCSPDGRYVYVPGNDQTYISDNHGESFQGLVAAYTNCSLGVFRDRNVIGINDGQIQQYTMYQMMRYLPGTNGSCVFALNA